MNIVFDTNVIISAICFPLSIPRKTFDLAREKCDLLISKETFEELTKVLLRAKFDNYIELDLRVLFLKEYYNHCREIEIIQKFNNCRDIKDNKFLDVAVNGSAEYLISGDSDLLILSPFLKVEIITPETFLDRNK